MSTFGLLNLFLLAEINSPAFKNSCFDGTDVAGTQINFFTTGIKCTNTPASLFYLQYIRGPVSISTTGSVFQSLISTTPLAVLLPVSLMVALCFLMVSL